MLDDIKSYVEVVEQKNFTKAANRLGFTQPSISAHVKRLEAYFNATLVERGRGNKEFIVTKNGQIAYEASKRLLEMVEEARAQIARNNAATERFSLKIGSSFTIGNYFLPSLIGDYLHATQNNVKVELAVDYSERIAEKVVEGELDIGLVAGRFDKEYALRKVAFSSDRLLLVAAAGLEANPNHLEEQTWILREDTTDTWLQQKSYLESSSIVPRETLIFHNDYAIKEAVKKGMGVTLLPERVVRDELTLGALVQLPMSRRMSRSYYYLLRNNQELSAPLSTFIDMLDNYDSTHADK